MVIAVFTIGTHVCVRASCVHVRACAFMCGLGRGLGLWIRRWFLGMILCCSLLHRFLGFLASSLLLLRRLGLLLLPLWRSPGRRRCTTSHLPIRFLGDSMFGVLLVLLLPFVCRCSLSALLFFLRLSFGLFG